MNEYNFNEIEAKWQKHWADTNYGKSDDFSSKPKFYSLIEFPYPSGSGLHVGHCMMYSAADAHARMMRMRGYNVMFPMGWDAFGLPTENYAIKNKVKPQVVTENAVKTFKAQQQSIGYSFDWSREINTTDPTYYKWTQWIFLQFYKHAYIDGKLIEVADNDITTPRMAYQAEMPVNWCPSCKIVLANEEVINGACERCGTQSEKRKQKQWMLRITSYADRLIDDLNTVDYLDKIRTQQINWIGKSTGSEIDFKIVTDNGQLITDNLIKVFTTRADTLFGCTYVVLAPENPMVDGLKAKIKNWDEVEKYVKNAKSKSDLERTELEKDKTGVRLDGIKATNPINNEEVDVWIADYVLANYGTGAVMAVPAHDDRDWDFAKKYGIEIKEAIIPSVIDRKNPPRSDIKTVSRNVIHAIIRNPKDGKYLFLKWKKFDWLTFVVGGIETGENAIGAAKREILEETGYKNLKVIKVLGSPVKSEYFAAHKDENRIAFATPVLFELENDERDEVDSEEKEKHEVQWLDLTEVSTDRMTCAEFEIWMKRLEDVDYAFTDYGVLTNSGEFSGLTSDEAKDKITEKLKEKKSGDFTTNYKLRDWIFSRQHYWGEPIPIIHCDKCGTVPVPEEQLPVVLPEVENYEPSDNGESPLAAISSWVDTKCPACGSTAHRETDTMPNWAGSSWYFLRYCDPHNDSFFKKPTFVREEIEPTESDQTYLEEFKKIYTDLEAKGIKTWAANRFMLNGLNRKLWLHFRTISVMGWKKDLEQVEKYIINSGYSLESIYPYGKLFTKGGIRFEFVSVEEKDGKLISYSEKNTQQEMSANDLPDFPLGVLDNFHFRTVAPEYNLSHYKFISQNESETRNGLGDEEKIKFLEEWLKANNSKRLYWMPVDLYNGGPEHITLHLLYSRFWHKFLYDLQVVPTSEPYQKRIQHGIILGPDGQKMSKSKGNVINPDEMVEKFGADTLRAYIMFIGPYDQESAWNMAGIQGVHRFLKRVWNNFEKVKDTKDTNDLLVKLNQTIASVTDDLEEFHVNTIISKLMELNNAFEKCDTISPESFKSFLQILYPACPHIASELWQKLDDKTSIELTSWPTPKQEFLLSEEIEIAVQINGKTRQIIKIKPSAPEEEVENLAKNDEKISNLIQNQQIKKTIYVSGRILNFVI